MLFSVLKRDARANAYALTSTEAVAALSRLRRQTFPSLVQVPPFTPKTASQPLPAWLQTAARQAFYALVIAGLVLTAAITIPSVLSWRDGGSASAASALRSSIGPTGTADTTVEDLSVGTFTGRIPFIQQHRYATVASGAIPAAEQFVMGAREAQLASYVTDVGEQMTLRYLSNAGQTQDAVALLESEKKKAEEEAARLALAAGSPASGISLGGPSSGGSGAGTPWGQTSIATGTRLATTITFYACIGNGFCGNTASGLPVSVGHAACSYNLPFGTRFQVEGDPTGQVFTCTDRGALSSTWVDVWFYTVDEGYAWQSNVGSSGTIVILG